MIPALWHDALIIGGGPAGATVAIALARAGRYPVLIEKSRDVQDKVCGEFLSPESLPYFRSMGIHPERLGAQTIHSVRVVSRDLIAEAPLPNPGLSLSRRILDENLLRCAREAGVSLLRGYTVEHLSRETRETFNSWHAQITDAAQTSISIRGGDAFLATGKHDLRGWPRLTQDSQNTLIALKMGFALSPEQQAELARYVELILFPGGYAGLQPVEPGCANLCLLITREKLRSLGGRWDRLLDHMQHHSPYLARRLGGAKPMFNRPLALSSIPYGYCTSLSVDEISPWRLGDQAAVIPSFCGDGIAIALYTAKRAAELYLGGATAATFHREVRREFKKRLYYTKMLSRLIITMPSLANAVRLWPSLLTEIFTATRLSTSAIQAASDVP